MGLLTGSVSVSRYRALQRPEPNFELVAFREILPGSEVRESAGFVPYEPEAAFEVGAGRYAFRVRIDRLRPDPTAVKERLKQLVATELETSGSRYVGARKKKELRQLAEEELIVRTSPRTKIIECAIDGEIIYIGSGAKSELGTVLLLLRRAGVETTPKVPWIDQGLPDLYSDVIETGDETESLYGCHFLKALIGDPDFLVEPEMGRARLATPGARIGLTGEILPDLHRYLERGAEILALKLQLGETRFTLDGPTFRLTGLSLPAPRSDHWTLNLDDRLGRISDLYDQLEERFERLIARPGRRAGGGEAAPS